MLFKNINSNVEIEDSQFDLIYPKKLRAISGIHFTPIHIAKIAARYLTDGKSKKILDVGSGAGKFCMIGSVCTDGYFVGIEQRKNLVNTANRISKHYNLQNIEFINSNITDIDFKAFDAFYLYNPFFEHVSRSTGLDNKIELKRELYEEYTSYVNRQLDEMIIGTKLVTYFCFLKEVPESYKMTTSMVDDKLKFWKKVD